MQIVTSTTCRGGAEERGGGVVTKGFIKEFSLPLTFFLRKKPPPSSEGGKDTCHGFIPASPDLFFTAPCKLVCEELFC